MSWRIVVLGAIIGLGAVVAGARPVASRAAAALQAAPFLAANAKRPGVVTTASGLQYRVIAPGRGDRAGRDDIATVDYVGTIAGGAVFVRGRKTDLYVSEQTAGLSEALMLMPVHARYRFWVPPTIGHGNQAKPGIPAGSVLVYDVVLRDFRNRASDGPEQE